MTQEQINELLKTLMSRHDEMNTVIVHILEKINNLNRHLERLTQRVNEKDEGLNDG